MDYVDELQKQRQKVVALRRISRVAMFVAVGAVVGHWLGLF